MRAPCASPTMAVTPVVNKLATLTFVINFITDVIHHGQAKVAYCPTVNMLANFFYKPFQGSLFCKFWNEILNADPD